MQRRSTRRSRPGANLASPAAVQRREADQRATQKLLTNALNVLKAVYDKKAFVQAKAKQAPLRLISRTCSCGTGASYVHLRIFFCW